MNHIKISIGIRRKKRLHRLTESSLSNVMAVHRDRRSNRSKDRLRKRQQKRLRDFIIRHDLDVYSCFCRACNGRIVSRATHFRHKDVERQFIGAGFDFDPDPDAADHDEAKFTNPVWHHRGDFPDDDVTQYISELDETGKQILEEYLDRICDNQLVVSDDERKSLKRAIIIIIKALSRKIRHGK
jgi:hypothetical protein